MSQSTQEKWAKTRQKGYFRFVFTVGVIFWGVPSGLFSWLLIAVKNSPQEGALNSLKAELPSLPMSLLLFAVTGVFFGHWIWTTAEKKYRSHQQRH